MLQPCCDSHCDAALQVLQTAFSGVFTLRKYDITGRTLTDGNSRRVLKMSFIYFRTKLSLWPCSSGRSQSMGARAARGSGMAAFRPSSEGNFGESISDTSEADLSRISLLKKPPSSSSYAHTHTHTGARDASTINLLSVATTAKHKANHSYTTGLPRSAL